MNGKDRKTLTRVSPSSLTCIDLNTLFKTLVIAKPSSRMNPSWRFWLISSSNADASSRTASRGSSHSTTICECEQETVNKNCYDILTTVSHSFSLTSCMTYLRYWDSSTVLLRAAAEMGVAPRYGWGLKVRKAWLKSLLRLLSSKMSKKPSGSALSASAI